MLDVTLIAHHQPPAVIHPPAAALDCPALARAGAGADRAPTCGALAGSAHHRRDRRFHAPPAPIPAEGLARVGLIRAPRRRACPWAAAGLRDTQRGHRGLCQLALMGAGAIAGHPARQAVAVSHDHQVAARADCRGADGIAPLFAGTTRPSRTACAHARWRWASSWPRRARHPRAQVPSCDHACRRRQPVVGEPS
jgi:hypothetical protein